MATVGDIQVEIDTALVQNLKELAELVASYSSTNEMQRKRIDELLARLEKANQRAEKAEADARDVRAWADAVPVEAIRRVYKSSHTADMAADRKVRQWLEKIG